MSDELILDVSFDSQTVTDATENWTLSGTPNVTYEQISGGSGYSLVTGKLGTPPTLVAVDQEAIYNEYTIDFNLYVKPSYTDTGWFSFFSLYAGMNYSGDYRARVYNGLTISLEIGGSSTEVTIDSPTGRWIHITIISEYDSDTGAYTAYLYVDSVLRTYKQGSRLNGSPFMIGKELVLFNRGSSSFFLPNTPGLAMDNLTVIAGIHVPNQTPAISLPNLSRVFQNFCTWISSQLSAVAKSGSYNDLSDKPTISTVNDGTLTIQQNGTNVATFTANQSTAATANITVPTAVSELTNDSGYLTSSSNLDASKLTSGTVDIARLPQGALERLVKVANEAARYALTTADVQLGDTVQQLDTGIMYIVTDADHLDSAAGYTEYTAGTAASVPWSGVTGKPTFAAVATSGAYSDLTGTPTIPTVNNATLTIQRNGTTLDTFTANASVDKTINISTADDTKIPLAGSNAISGSLIPATDNSIDIGSSTNNIKALYTKGITINGTQFLPSDYVPRSGGAVFTDSAFSRNVDDSSLIFRGGINAWGNGAQLELCGKDFSNAGTWSLTSNNGSDYSTFTMSPNGTIYASHGAGLDVTYAIRYNSAEVDFFGGDSRDNGSSLQLHGKDFVFNDYQFAGAFTLQARRTSDYQLIGFADGTLTWNGQPIQTSSDKRLKQQISNIDDKLLDAWEDVELAQFKYNDAVGQKGDNARLHTGYVVQQIDSACKSHGVDISEYGLYCHEEYPERTEEVEVTQEDGTTTKETKVIREASEHYSLRYTEVYAVECMYLRRCIAKLTARIEELEKGKEQEASK